MLKALENQLKSLASQDEEIFLKALQDHLGHKPNEEQVKAVKEFIFLLPPTLKQLSRYLNEPSVPSEVKKISGNIITYIYDPEDYLPEGECGFLGYLDDAYLVVSAYLKLQDVYLKDWRDRSPEDLELLKRVRDLYHIPKIVIPDITAKIDILLESWLKGETAYPEGKNE